MLTNVGRMPTHYAPVLALSLRFLVGPEAPPVARFASNCDNLARYRVFP